MTTPQRKGFALHVERSRNRFLTPQEITNEALRILTNNLRFAHLVNRDFDAEFSGKIGDTIRVRKPVRYLVRA